MAMHIYCYNIFEEKQVTVEGGKQIFFTVRFLGEYAFGFTWPNFSPDVINGNDLPVRNNVKNLDFAISANLKCNGNILEYEESRYAELL